MEGKQKRQESFACVTYPLFHPLTPNFLLSLLQNTQCGGTVEIEGESYVVLGVTYQYRLHKGRYTARERHAHYKCSLCPPGTLSVARESEVFRRELCGAGGWRIHSPHPSHQCSSVSPFQNTHCGETLEIEGESYVVLGVAYWYRLHKGRKTVEIEGESYVVLGVAYRYRLHKGREEIEGESYVVLGLLRRLKTSLLSESYMVLGATNPPSHPTSRPKWPSVPLQNTQCGETVEIEGESYVVLGATNPPSHPTSRPKWPSVPLQNTQCGETVEIEGESYVVLGVTYRYRLHKGRYTARERQLDVQSRGRFLVNMYLTDMLDRS
ncbi:unnamed protein product [Closterium sp. NIES-65]|nr:unnamed protein product [Closterium sp. NIES-65]